MLNLILLIILLVLTLAAVGCGIAAYVSLVRRFDRLTNEIQNKYEVLYSQGKHILQYQCENAETLEDLYKKYDELSTVQDIVKKLAMGVVPDYEEAKRAADEMNRFNNGVANILGFDPMQALKDSRNEEKKGSDH